MSQPYSQKVLEYFLNPRNIGTMDNPDAWATVANPQCGDEMTIFLRIGRRPDGEEYIEDARVQTYGCVAAIATSSMATELVKGKTLTEALEISGRAIKEALGGLPASKVHCSLLADQALKKAIHSYLARKNQRH
ncbi:MAG: iron-sulfur cluster assembly scaffold protein, partial [Armatimonadetes bacterium]|nr:iron-sulfur cluster assembly scaffold protein [Armatimonadota bacterium]